MKRIRTYLFILLISLSSLSYAQPLGGDFKLTDHHGRSFELSQLRSKVVLLFFGFTHCMSVCPDTLAKIKAAIQSIKQPEQFAVLFITVDPERDTIPRLKEYLAPFGNQFLGLTGSPDELQKVFDAYQIRVKLMKKTADDNHYMVDHTADIYVLDRTGKITALIPYGMPPEHIQQALQAQFEPQTTLLPETVLANLDSWQVTDLQGKQQDLKVYQGKALVVNFWASWCPSCRKELPSLNQVWKTLKTDHIQMLAINIGDASSAAQAFLQDYPIDFTVWLDENATSFNAWDITGLPTTLLIDAEGRVQEKIVGERYWMEPSLLEKIKNLSH